MRFLAPPPHHRNKYYLWGVNRKNWGTGPAWSAEYLMSTQFSCPRASFGHHPSFLLVSSIFGRGRESFNCAKKMDDIFMGDEQDLWMGYGMEKLDNTEF